MEFEALSRIAALLPQPPPGELWIGDDAALVHLGATTVAVSTDTLVAGVHFDLTLTTIADAGWKAMAVNVSDLAAMGCVATRAVISVAGPPDTDLDGLYDGVSAASEWFGCAVVGGDLTAAPVLVVTVSVLGNGTLAPPPVTRNSARPRDEVWLTGPVGGAAAGLRHLRQGDAPPHLRAAHARPVARVAEGTAAREIGATSMIDVSDGFAADLGHILDASGVGVVLDDLPVAGGATADEALSGGDDYELVFTCPPDTPVNTDFASRGLRPPIRVGTIVPDSVRLLKGEPLTARGWEHPLG